MTLSSWILQDFLQRFDEWAARHTPGQNVRLEVMKWIHDLQADPYSEAAPNQDFGLPFWLGVIPGATDGKTIVVCSYTVDPVNELVRCSSFATLNLPLG